MQETTRQSRRPGEGLNRVLQTLATWGSEAAPTASALAARLRLDESSVRYSLGQLEGTGLIRLTKIFDTPKKSPRAASITLEGWARLRAQGFGADVGPAQQIVEPDVRRLMREFELVHAGEAGVEFETAPQLVTIESRLGIRPDDDYLVPVVGECMTPVFQAGDVVIIRPDGRPADGTLVHVDVRLSNETWEPLLRIFEADESQGAVWLTHLYPEKATILVPGECTRVRGRFMGFYRDAEGAYAMLREMRRAVAQGLPAQAEPGLSSTCSSPVVKKAAATRPAKTNASLNSNGVRR